MVATLFVFLIIGAVICFIGGKLIDDGNVRGLWLLTIGAIMVVVTGVPLIVLDVKGEMAAEKAHLSKSQAARQEMVNTLKADNWEEIRSNDTDTVMKLNRAVLTITPTKEDDNPKIKLEFSGATKPVEKDKN